MKTLMSWRALGLAAFALAGSRVHADWQTNDVLTKLSPAEIEAQLPNEDPAYYLVYASRWMKAGDLPAAMRWFYIGQLRHRVSVQANPKQDTTLFAALSAGLGGPMNRYGALHIDQWLAAIDGALAWDAAHANGLTDKDKFAVIYGAQRDGLTKLKSYMVSHQAQFVAAATGKEPMPADWPAITPIKSAKDLEGVFGRWNVGSVTGIFFPGSPTGTQWFRVTELEISAVSENRILAIARGKNGEIARGELDVKVADGAASVALPNTIGNNARGGGSKGTAFLRRNAARELVVERDEIIEESHNPGAVSTLEPHRYWQKAPLKTADVTPSH